MKRFKLIFAFLLTTIFMAGIPQEGFAQKSKSVEIKIKTSAVCGHCKIRIEEALAYTSGVTAASFDLDTKVVTVTYKTAKTSPEVIRAAISKAGYDADEVAADPIAYEKLPACCKKNAPPHH